MVTRVVFPDEADRPIADALSASLVEWLRASREKADKTSLEARVRELRDVLASGTTTACASASSLADEIDASARSASDATKLACLLTRAAVADDGELLRVGVLFGKDAAHAD